LSGDLRFVQDARLWNRFWNQLAAHRLSDALVGGLAVEALNVDLRRGGLLVSHRVGDLTGTEPPRREPRAVGVAKVVQGHALDPGILRGGVEAAPLDVAMREAAALFEANTGALLSAAAIFNSSSIRTTSSEIGTRRRDPAFGGASSCRRVH
jgi:hypothetical protein